MRNDCCIYTQTARPLGSISSMPTYNELTVWAHFMSLDHNTIRSINRTTILQQQAIPSPTIRTVHPGHTQRTHKKPHKRITIYGRRHIPYFDGTWLPLRDRTTPYKHRPHCHDLFSLFLDGTPINALPNSISGHPPAKPHLLVLYIVQQYPLPLCAHLADTLSLPITCSSYFVANVNFLPQYSPETTFTICFLS